MLSILAHKLVFYFRQVLRLNVCSNTAYNERVRLEIVQSWDSKNIYEVKSH